MLQFLLTICDESKHEEIEYIYYEFHTYMLKFAVSKFKREGRRNYFYDAEDAVQNAFVRITKYINGIDFTLPKSEVKNYVFSILDNEICNMLKDKEDTLELYEECFEDVNYNLLEELETKEHLSEIIETIRRMDQKYSTTLYLVYCRGMTVNEVAELMGISVKTVYTRFERGRLLLINSVKGANIYG